MFATALTRGVISEFVLDEIGFWLVSQLRVRKSVAPKQFQFAKV